MSELRKSTRLEALVPEPKFRKNEGPGNPLAEAILEAFGVTPPSEELPPAEEVLFGASERRQ